MDVSGQALIDSRTRSLHREMFISSTTLSHQRTARLSGAQPRTNWRSALRKIRYLFAVPSVPENPFSVLVSFEVEKANGSVTFLTRTALIDTGAPCNIMSRQVGELLVSGLESDTAYPLLHSHGGVAYALRKIDVLWWCRDSTGHDTSATRRILRFPEKFVSSPFHIVQRSFEVDLIIGRPDIIKYDLLGYSGTKLSFFGAGSCFRSQLPHVDNHTVADQERDAASRQQNEREQMEQDQRYNEQRRQYAHSLAHSYAIRYAQEQSSQFGPECFQQAYKMEYERKFADAQAQYSKMYPRY